MFKRTFGTLKKIHFFFGPFSKYTCWISKRIDRQVWIIFAKPERPILRCFTISCPSFFRAASQAMDEDQIQMASFAAADFFERQMLRHFAIKLYLNSSIIDSAQPV